MSTAHISTAERQAARDSKPERGTVRDPVCDMQVDPEQAAGIRTVQGRNFFLCSGNCFEKFDKEPERYTTADQPPESGTHGSQRHAGCH